MTPRTTCGLPPHPDGSAVLQGQVRKRYIENFVVKKCQESDPESRLAGFSVRYEDEDMTVGYARLWAAGRDPACQIHTLYRWFSGGAFDAFAGPHAEGPA